MTSSDRRKKHGKRIVLGASVYDNSPSPTSLYRSWKTKFPFLMREELYYVGYRIVRVFRSK